MLIIEYASTLNVCSVSVAPGAVLTTLLVVLEAAKAGATPAGCVTSFSALSPNLPVEQINGAHIGEKLWYVSLNGGTAIVARLGQLVNLGDSILPAVEMR